MITALQFTGALLIEGAFFMALLAWREWTAYKREKDLLNRLMARDLPEYTQQTQQQEKGPVDPHRRRNIIAAHRRRHEGKAAGGRNPLLDDDEE